MRALRHIVQPFLLACLAGLLCAMSGCGGAGQNGPSAIAADGELLRWPPPAGSPRLSSASDTVLWGKDTALQGPGTHAEGNALVFGSAFFVPWALYSVGSLGTENELTGVAVNYAETPVVPGDGTAIFVGLANYRRGAWDWFDPAAAPWSHSLTSGADYRNTDGEAYLAVVLAGPGEGRVDTVTFTSSGDLVSPPQNLTAVINDELEAELDWDDVTNADGYNVWRASLPGLSDAEQLNGQLVPDSDYLDVIMPSDRGRYYFYYVTAVGFNESERSNVARVWSPEVNMPPPENFRVGVAGSDYFMVQWDWPYTQEPSGGFKLFIDTEPDFIIDPDTENYVVTGYKPRQHTFTDRMEGVIYYVKMCARTNDDRLGRMTDEIQATVGSLWTWEDVYTIDVGQPPVHALVVDGQFAVCFIDGGNVRFALGSGDTWNAETVMGTDFATYLDMAYGGGKYVLASQDSHPGDAWAATGTPGDWVSERVHGNGSTALGHPESGFSIAVGASDTEFAVAHQALPCSEFPQDPGLILHTRSISGGSWTTEIIREPEPDNALSTCFAWIAGNLHVLSADVWMPEVLWGDRDGGWNWQDLRPSGTLYAPRYYDMHWFNDEWYTTAFDSGNKDLYLAHGSTLPWTFDMIAGGGGADLGHYARLAVEGEEAIALFYGGGKYNFGLYSGDWHHQPISVPGVDAGDYGPFADVALLTGSPYIFFQDEGDGNIKVAKGTPPPE